MNLKEDGGIDAELSEAELQARRHAAALALGLYPAAVVWPDRDEEANSAHAVEAEVGRQHLTEAEWHSLTPLLPAEAPQAKTMSTREFLEAVLNAMRRTSWISRTTPAAKIEPVRRRFGRWAHHGVFQAVAAALPHLDLLPETKRLLALAGQRAGKLKTRASR